MKLSSSLDAYIFACVCLYSPTRYQIHPVLLPTISAGSQRNETCFLTVGMVNGPGMTSPQPHGLIHPDKIKTDRPFAPVACSQPRHSSGSMDGEGTCKYRRRLPYRIRLLQVIESVRILYGRHRALAASQ